MRTPLAIALSIIGLVAAGECAVAAEVQTASKIDAVLVFPSGAEVTRTARVKLAPGAHTLVFSDLPASVIDGSVRVESGATGTMQIVSTDMRRQLVKVDEPGSAAEKKRLEDELRTIRGERPTLDGLLQAATAQTKLANLTPAREQRTEVRVHVSAAAALEADFKLRYQVPNATWQPSYEARLVTGSRTAEPELKVTRRAAIQQRTGEAWTDVAIQLSITQPVLGTRAPEISPFAIDAPRPHLRAAGGGIEHSREARAGREAEACGIDREREVAEEARAWRGLGTQQSVLVLPGKVSVPSSGEIKCLTQMEVAYKPTLFVRTTPKLDDRAFFYSRLSMPAGEAMLPGSVAIFRDGMFVGTDRLPQLAQGEDYELGFGADDAIKVTYAVVDEPRGSSGLASTVRAYEKRFRISVKNTHDRRLPLSVLDQVPVAQNPEIKIELLGRTLPTRENRGIIAFDSEIGPDEEKVIEFGYKVSWPTTTSIDYRLN